MKLEPFSGSLSTQMYPPLCATMPYTVARPRPVLWVVGLVVKNGSKRWAFTSGVMPWPVSVTTSSTYGRRESNAEMPVGVALGELHVHRLDGEPPPLLMASRALRARFITTCSICP